MSLVLSSICPFDVASPGDLYTPRTKVILSCLITLVPGNTHYRHALKTRSYREDATLHGIIVFCTVVMWHAFSVAIIFHGAVNETRLNYSMD